MRLINTDNFSKEVHEYFKNLIQQGKNDVDIVNCNADLHKIMNSQVTINGWIPCIEERWPETDDYILLSFANFDTPLVGRYEEDEEGGAFYVGDDNESCTSQGLIVNAWMPLPKKYEEEEEMP